MRIIFLLHRLLASCWVECHFHVLPSVVFVHPTVKKNIICFVRVCVVRDAIRKSIINKIKKGSLFCSVSQVKKPAPLGDILKDHLSCLLVPSTD